MSRKKMSFANELEFYYISSPEETEYIYSEIFTEQQYLRHGIVINEGDCIFDVGANIGLFSLFVNSIQKQVKIYAFEPIEQTFFILKENTRLYNLDNVQLFNYGISSEDNPEKIFVFYPNMAGNSTTKPGDIIADADDVKEEINSEPIEDLFASFFQEEQQVKCEVKTLSSVINELGIDSIDLLKIDVEGAEYEVLQGIADKDWPKIKQIVGEVHNKQGRLDKIQKLLISQGFKIELEKRAELPTTYVDTYNLYAVR
ncbi:FkbM family methyltransferase [Calothrix sp. NIES-2098]|uniref:FkbM family methyltransferase n=1 Tax=Calothrix sp. NIES-2098 TaxID=1954171 RepID=UPI000B609F77|nr:methyltransferase FkbM family protein [Calothrix sp. NIES-2098]